ncbi:ficolin-2-like [Orbicella faveolata]|uniref:ficolin-2-like n=1 Tax=Orbicella faveolata TaxID=48498 RepID=UPI0009E59D9E|nr:ficolin-2-like [Orbicella faveolata]
MHAWIISLFCTAVYGISRISQPGLKAVNFARPIEGWKLNGSVISEKEVDSESSCRFECVQDERCKSLNFGSKKNNAGRHMCQLSDSDRFVGRVNFTEAGDFRYRGIKSICESENSPCGENGVCIPDPRDKSLRCNCLEGHTGKPCKPKSCAQILQDGFTSSGVYTINPDGGKPMQVLCDMVTDGGGWTVFQRRLDGSVDFFLGWESYKNGFGNLKGEFWLGNNNIHRLTAAGNVSLRVDLEDFEDDVRYAEYTTFKVADEEDNFRLVIGGYNGTAGDSMAVHNGSPFSTKDNDTTDICAQLYKGAWWYKDCHESNLNGLYLKGAHSSDADGVNWKAFRGWQYSLKRTEMKVK